MTTTTITKVHTPESIKTLLSTSLPAIERAILVIYERQTLDEQATESTSHNNGVGFSAVDAEILSSFAAQIQRKQSRGVALGACLSEKQMVIAKKRMMVYARQLAEVANEKAGLSQEEVKALLRAAKVAEKAESKTIAEEPIEIALERVEAMEGYHKSFDAWQDEVNSLEGIGGVEYRLDVAEEKARAEGRRKAMEMFDEAEAKMSKVKAPSIANDDFKSAKAKIVAWMMSQE